MTTDACPGCQNPVTIDGGRRWCLPGCPSWGASAAPPPPPEPTLPAPDPRSHARADDPDTSHQAALDLGDGTMLSVLLSVFDEATVASGARYGLTAEEASRRAGYTAADGAWKRVSDLKAAELIEDTGTTRAGSSGREQTVLQITSAGISAHRGRTPLSQPETQLATDLVTSESAIRAVLAACQDADALAGPRGGFVETDKLYRIIGKRPEGTPPWETDTTSQAG